MNTRTVLFATPFLTDNAQQFIRAVTGLPQLRVGVITQDAEDRLWSEVRERVAAHWRVDDALDPDQLTHAAHSLAGRLGPLHRLLSVNEQIQIPVAVARERLGLAGMRVEHAYNFRDKSRMKALLRDAGVPCARYRLVGSDAEAREFLRETGYPVVAKPPAGAASQATYRIEDQERLDEVLREAAPAPGRELLLEEFVTGDEFSFDAFVLNRRIVFHSGTRYDPTPLHAMRNPWIQWMVLLPREVDGPGFDEIRRVAPQALEALGLETGMCHLEWFRRRDGSIVVSEVGARPPGAQITTLISRAHDFDSVAAWARMMVDGIFDETPPRSYAAGAAYLRGQGRGHVRAVHGIDQVQRELGHLVTDARLPQVGQEMAKSYEGEGFIIVRHPETAVVQHALRRIVALVQVELGE
jgi:formate-dependent phosphoribosylglycinamide formyltransferase (GAR transformylase)